MGLPCLRISSRNISPSETCLAAHFAFSLGNRPDCEIVLCLPFMMLRQLAELMRSRPVDVLCHHAAMVTDYKSPDFDVVAAYRQVVLLKTAELPR